MKVTVERLDHFGRGISTIDGKVCFISNALPNEVVDIKIAREKKKYLEAEVVQYIEKSPFRIEEECPYSSICGGCSFNHLCFNQENLFKKQKVKDLLTRYGNVEDDKVENIIYHDRNSYRNKITLHGKDQRLGLYAKGSHDIIPIQSCLLVNHKINDMIQILHNCNEDIREVAIKTSNDLSQIMVSITGSITNKDLLLSKCDVLIVNGDCLTDQETILTNIGDKKYYQSIQSFFQVNHTLTFDLYEEVLSYVKMNHFHTVLDLYCGTGTIGIYISDYVDQVIGVDYNSSNIRDANRNKELNHSTNTHFICDKVENRIDSFSDIDFIIVDPPRAGLDSKTRDILKIILPQSIIYVSCDPVTLARDLKELEEKYIVREVKPFNMFPRTYHVECVCLLMKKKS